MKPISEFKQPIFGTMRFASLSETKCIKLLTYILENGGKRFHSSLEYDTFDFFAHSLKIACNDTGINTEELSHIVKLATPHFGETSFDANALDSQINEYRTRLDTNQLETIQWMARIDLKDEPSRLECLTRQQGEIEHAVANLKKTGKIRRFGCFPYTDSFRSLVLTQPWCDVVFDYYNPLENTDNIEFDKFRPDQSFIAIRPFMPMLEQKKATHQDWTIPDLVKFATNPPPSESVIVSTSTIPHAKDILTMFNCI